MHKKDLSRFILLLLLGGVVYACMEEGLFSERSDLPAEVSTAQRWYESAVTDGDLFWQSSDGGETNLYTPDWNRAFTNEDDEFTITEVHLVGEERLLFVSPESVERYESTGDDRYKASDVRLVVRTDKTTGETDGFIMIVHPDLLYVESQTAHPLRDFSYLSRNRLGFSGMIYYHDLKGAFVNGWRYVEGVAYAIVPSHEVEENPSGSLKSTTYCDYYCERIEHYLDWYVNGDYQNTSYNGYTERCYYTNCWTDYGTGSSGGYGGGGGGGNTGNTTTPPSAEVQNIIDDFDLDNNGKKELNETLENMLEKCGYQYIYNYLDGKNCSFSNVKYSSTSTEGGYDPATKELTFRNSSSIEGSLPEEFIHLYQDSYYSGGISQYLTVGKPNIEFEAKLMQDILCILSLGACQALGATESNGIYYTKWLDKITNGYTTVPSYLDLSALYSDCGNKNYWDFLNDFKNNPNIPQYNKPINANLMPNALLNMRNNSECYDD